MPIPNGLMYFQCNLLHRKKRSRSYDPSSLPMDFHRRLSLTTALHSPVRNSKPSCLRMESLISLLLPITLPVTVLQSVPSKHSNKDSSALLELPFKRDCPNSYLPTELLLKQPQASHQLLYSWDAASDHVWIACSRIPVNMLKTNSLNRLINMIQLNH